SLRRGDNLRALKFLESFGPLHIPTRALTPPGQLRVELKELWGWHRRFCLVAQLWEARDSKDKLCSAWRDAYEHSVEVDEYGPLGFGDSKGCWHDPPKTYRKYCW